MAILPNRGCPQVGTLFRELVLLTIDTLSVVV